MEERKLLHVLVIGGSAGSLSMVLEIIPFLKRNFALAVIIVFHRKASEDTMLVDVLSHHTEFEVKEIEDKDEILPFKIFIAPAEYHVLIEKNFTLTLDDSERINYSRPSIDVTFESAADIFGGSLGCVLLSGANNDGVKGLQIAQENGAFVVIQDPAFAEVPYMPQQAMDHLSADFVLTHTNIQSMLDVFSMR